MDLARGNLTAMAAAAGLRISFSTERSVADEIARESTADVATVRAPLQPAVHTCLGPFSQEVSSALCPKSGCVRADGCCRDPPARLTLDLSSDYCWLCWRCCAQRWCTRC